MSHQYVEPNAKSVKTLLEMLFGDDLAVNDADYHEVPKPYVATYIDADEKIVAMCICDLALVARAGAAFSMVPADVAEEIIGGDELSETFQSNFYELMNICSKLMLSDDSAHLKLDKTLGPDQDTGTLVAAMEDPSRYAFTVDIPGYGPGEMIYLIAA
ncbi:MAG: hypothetical protein AB8B86_01735 [Pseudomonadales bacterium]